MSDLSLLFKFSLLQSKYVKALISACCAVPRHYSWNCSSYDPPPSLYDVDDHGMYKNYNMFIHFNNRQNFPTAWLTVLRNDLMLLVLKLMGLLMGCPAAGPPTSFPHISTPVLSNNYRIHVTALKLVPFFTFPSTVTASKQWTVSTSAADISLQ